jgi:spectinomycin phosphotransferase
LSEVRHEPRPWNGGNILIRTDGQPPVLSIVDWDDVLLAPKESDLMFIGGGIDEIWKTERERAVFYQGYRDGQMNLTALAYHRYERVLEDLVVISEQLVLTDEGGANRERHTAGFRAILSLRLRLRLQTLPITR